MQLHVLDATEMPIQISFSREINSDAAPELNRVLFTHRFHSQVLLIFDHFLLEPTLSNHEPLLPGSCSFDNLYCLKQPKRTTGQSFIIDNDGV